MKEGIEGLVVEQLMCHGTGEAAAAVGGSIDPAQPLILPAPTAPHVEGVGEGGGGGGRDGGEGLLQSLPLPMVVMPAMGTGEVARGQAAAGVAAAPSAVATGELLHAYEV